MANTKRKQEKSPMEKYTFKMFLKQFPNDEACLEWLKSKRWPDGIFCNSCQKVTGHSYTASRKCYTCHECGLHVHPTAGTIFHKSSTPLTTWFYVAFLLAQTRGGISAKQIQRETGVTYKTAWRMCTLIRQQLDEDKSPFGGEKQVEVDETYLKLKRGSATVVLSAKRQLLELWSAAAVSIQKSFPTQRKRPCNPLSRKWYNLEQSSIPMNGRDTTT